MSNTLKVFKEEMRRLTDYNKNIGVTLIMSIGVPLFYVGFIASFMKKGTFPVDARLMVEGMTNIYGFIYIFVIALFPLMMLNLDTFITDKQQKAMETLLTTPLKLKDILLGKSIALFVFTYPFVLLSLLVFLLFIDLFLMHEVYLPNALIWVFCFTLVPLITFLTSVISGMGVLIMKRYVTISGFMSLVCFLIFMVPSIFMEKLVVGGFDFRLVFALDGLIACVLLAFSFLLYKSRLTKERVVLTS